MVRASDAGALDILGQRQAQTMEALGFAAQGAEREIGREINREMMERGAAQAAIEGGLQNIAGGVGQIGTAGVYGAQLGSKEKREKVDPTSVTPRGFADLGINRQGSYGIMKSLPNPISVPSSSPRRIADIGINEPGPGEIKRAIPNPLNIPNELEEILMGNYRLPFLKEGGMVTGGKFDHKTNPIDIIKKGQKIGEMTGGEVILNPAQQQKLSKESAYFRQLLKKFNKQK